MEPPPKHEGLNMVVANKQNLLNFKKNLQFLSKALELLDYKKELLTREIRRLADQAFNDREVVNGYLKEAFQYLFSAYLDNGKEAVKLISDTSLAHFSSKVREYSFMGVVLSEIEYKKVEEMRSLDYGLLKTSGNLDQAVQKFQAALDLMLNLSGTEISIYRLVSELVKIQRRINAIEKIFIPEYRETIKKIDFILEEKEREFISMTKILKTRFQENKP